MRTHHEAFSMSCSAVSEELFLDDARCCLRRMKLPCKSGAYFCARSWISEKASPRNHSAIPRREVPYRVSSPSKIQELVSDRTNILSIRRIFLSVKDLLRTHHFLLKLSLFVVFVVFLVFHTFEEAHLASSMTRIFSNPLISAAIFTFSDFCCLSLTFKHPSILLTFPHFQFQLLCTEFSAPLSFPLKATLFPIFLSLYNF